MLDPVRVDVYGSSMPINQIGTVSVPEPRMISVQVWDKSNVKAVEKAITASGLGLNPQADGTLIRIPIPELNEQRRKELTKVAGQYAEQARVEIGRAHVCTPVTNAHLVCRILLEKKTINT